jgi:molybdopterin converting factor subunit 1
MRVRLLAFAVAADRLGSRESTLELPAGADVAALRAEVVRRAPALAALADRLAIAVDGTLAADDAPLADGAEVALLPPVSGG